MPRINNLPIDRDIETGDYLVGYDAGGGAHKFGVEQLDAYFDNTVLDGYRNGRFPIIVDDHLNESHLRSDYESKVLVAGDGTEEDNAVIATSATRLQVGSAISSVVASQELTEGQILIIENLETGKRDFALFGTYDVASETIILDAQFPLEDYTNFTSSKGYKNKLTYYSTSSIVSEVPFIFDGNVTIKGSILDGDGNSIIQSNPVTLSGDNTFTGTNTFNDNQVVFEEGIRIDDSDTFGYTFPVANPAPENNQVLAIDASDNNSMKFRDVNELLIFGTDGLAEWTQDGYNGNIDIPADILPVATTTTIGAIKVGTNLGVSADGTLNATGSVGTFVAQDEGTQVAAAATTINFAGGDVTATAAGDVVTVTYNPGGVQFGSGSTEVALFAKGDNNGDNLIPATILPNATSTTKGVVSAGDNLSVSDGELTTGANVALLDSDQTFSGGNTFSGVNIYSGTSLFTSRPIISGATEGSIALRREDETPVNNDNISSLHGEAYSLSTETYQEFTEIATRYKDNTDFEYGQFLVNTNYVSKSNDTFSILTALTLDRYGATFDVGTTLNENVTIGSSSSKTLTVNATTSFESPITGSITELVNDRDTTETYKTWVGTQDEYAALDTYDGNTIYYTV